MHPIDMAALMGKIGLVSVQSSSLPTFLTASCVVRILDSEFSLLITSLLKKFSRVVYLLVFSGWRLEFIQPLKDATVSAGEQAVFSCVLSEAVPDGEIAWYINGVDIQSDENWEIQAKGNSYTLILKKAQPHHSGEVTFAARDAIESARLSVRGRLGLAERLLNPVLT